MAHWMPIFRKVNLISKVDIESRYKETQTKPHQHYHQKVLFWRMSFYFQEILLFCCLFCLVWWGIFWGVSDINASEVRRRISKREKQLSKKKRLQNACFHHHQSPVKANKQTNKKPKYHSPGLPTPQKPGFLYFFFFFLQFRHKDGPHL